MRKQLSIFLLLAAALGATTQPAPPPLHLKAEGFSIEPLETKPDDTDYMALQMFLPGPGQIPPNVNVYISRFGGSIQQYVDGARKQFLARKFDVISTTIVGDDAAAVEYAGKNGDNKLHWYARVILSRGRACLATAVATRDQWPTASAKLQACVDSLQLDKPALDAPATAPATSPATAPASDRLHPGDKGFSIAPLETRAGPATRMALLMRLPRTPPITPEVAVQIQPYDGGMKDYIDLTMKLFENSHLALIRMTRPGPDAATFECLQQINIGRVHLYYRVVLGNGRAYLATATAADEQWPLVAGALKACVNSLEADEANNAPPAQPMPQP